MTFHFSDCGCKLCGTSVLVQLFPFWVFHDLQKGVVMVSSNPNNCHLMGGFAICISGGTVQWGSCLQPHVLLSSMESEYTIASKVGCKVMWMWYLLEEISYDMSHLSQLLLDNKSGLQVAKHPEHQSTMKHVHRAYHWIRGHVDCGLITISHIPGDANPADIFTKPEVPSLPQYAWSSHFGGCWSHLWCSHTPGVTSYESGGHVVVCFWPFVIS